MNLFDRIQRTDLEWVRTLSQNPSLVRNQSLLKFFTRIGDGWIWGIVVLGLALFYEWTEIKSILALGLCAGLGSLLVYEVVKLSTKRVRPFIADPSLSPEVPPMDRYSFPSGHVMNNLAVGLAMCWVSPALGIPLCLMALFWGLLRIHFCVHYPTDILCGIILALPCAMMAKPFAAILLNLLS